MSLSVSRFVTTLYIQHRSFEVHSIDLKGYNLKDVRVVLCRQKQQEVKSVCVAQKNRRNISFLTWRSLRTMTTTMTTMKRKRSLYPMRTHRPPVRQTPTHQQEGIPAAVGTPSRALLNPSPRAPVPAPVGSPPQGEFGPADELPLRAAGERCSPGGAGRHRQELSPPAMRAAPPAAASLHVWSYPHPSTASPPGRSCPRQASMSHPPLREDLLPSDPFPLFVLFPPAATGHPKLGPLPRHSGYSTGPLDTCRGRAQVQREVTSNRWVFCSISRSVMRLRIRQQPQCISSTLSSSEDLSVQYSVCWQSKSMKCNDDVFAPPTGEKWHSSRRASIDRSQLVSPCFPSFHLWRLSWPPNGRQHLQPSSHALPTSQDPLPDDPHRRDPNGTGQTKVPPCHPLVPDVSPCRGAVTGQVWIVLGRDPQNSRA